MATPALQYDGEAIQHQALRWQEDLTGKERAEIASELERERFVPEFKWVKLGQLYVDEAYQRPVSYDRIWEIVTNFTWALMEPLWIADRKGKGTLYIVDGRHRFVSACTLGTDKVPELPCSIRRTEGMEEEAGIFLDLQVKRRRMTAAEQFPAKLIRKDPIALDLQKLMTRWGFKVKGGFSVASRSASQNEITAIGTLELIYHYGGRQRVDGVLQIIREAWDGKPPSTSQRMLLAINRVLERERKAPTTIARRLSEYTDPWALIERGERFGHSNGIPASEAISDVLLKSIE